MQALFLGHSVLMTHSGRQAIYGFPKNSGKHVQNPLSHCALSPHGDGLQGSITTGSAKNG